jgi:HD-GYP domain-containing protein (c-di-GMP phosphodiesterase class II)
MPKHALTKSVQRKLLLRLGLACLAVSVVLALVAYVRERDRVSQLVIERARQSVKRLNVQIVSLLDQPGDPDRGELRQILDEFSRGGMKYREGDYVIIGIYGQHGREWLREVDPEYQPIGPVNEYMDGRDHNTALGIDHWHQVTDIGGRAFIHVAAPLENGDGIAVAHIEGIFAVSDRELAALRARMLRTALYGIAIVLVTALLLYPIITALMGRLTKLTVKLLDANMETLQVLGSAIAKRDSDTDAHNFRVSVYSVRLAEAVGLEPGDIRSLIKGAFLHDVGKIGVPDDVLLKPGKLTEEEFEVMKRHVDHGVDIVKRSEWLEDARPIVGAHHEKFDGSGYFLGRRGEEIPVAARIFALADVFDALTSERPYKDPYSYEESMQILEAGRGTHFDPFLLDAFTEIARGMFIEFAGHDLDKPRSELGDIVRRYFQMEVDDLV